MKILFYGLNCSGDIFDEFLKLNPNPFSVAHRLFENAILKGLHELDNTITHKYIWQGKSNTCIIKGRQTFDENVDSSFLSYINMPLIKFFTLMISTLFSTTSWCIKNLKEKDKCVISSINYFPISSINYFILKLFKVKNIIILTDTSESNAYSKDNIKRSKQFYKLLFINIYVRMVRFIETHFDGYVFLCESMNSQINIKRKPWILIDGIFEDEGLLIENIEKEKAIMYAGTINSNLGLDMLINTFKEIEDKDIQLWIFGSGNYVKDMLKLTKGDMRIKYFGFQDRKTVFHYEQKASLLINLRDPKEGFTKYSFPSKTMEYMYSATPFMTTRLECYTQEYEDVLIFLSEYTKEYIKNKILDYFSLNDEDKSRLGIKARKFILENKKYNIQAKRLNDLLKSNIKREKETAI